MRIPAKLTAATAAITLGVASAALASAPGTHGRSQSAPGHEQHADTDSQRQGLRPGVPGRKKHVAGQKGTPFSQCVSAAAKLLGDQSGSDQSSTGS